MSLRAKLGGLTALLIIASGHAMADEPPPAVSDLNIGGLVMAGADDADARVLAGVKATFPLFHRSLGMQVEGGIGDDHYFGTGAHLFWRDPTMGLLGVVATLESQDGVGLNRAGAEAELYLGQFTLAGVLGYEDGPTKDGAFGRLTGIFYPDETVAVRVGGEFTPILNLARFAVEWQPMLDGYQEFSIFGTGEYTDRHTGNIMLGVRFHLGEEGVTLQRRERYEDPDFAIFNILPTAAGTGSNPAAPPPPTCTAEMMRREICFIDSDGTVIFFDTR